MARSRSSELNDTKRDVPVLCVHGAGASEADKGLSIFSTSEVVARYGRAVVMAEVSAAIPDTTSGFLLQHSSIPDRK